MKKGMRRKAQKKKASDVRGEETKKKEEMRGKRRGLPKDKIKKKKERYDEGVDYN
ncbi:hypothetical protein HID67_06875 [Pasteurella multocida]|uniref:hypothetical protein n=1 Tax=Pasteurella multocida TaxID=747 RepID=UPI0014614736|nr:hypothetical protein [Pasteurella multocida]NMR23067.1 hypothetical protein [Pasteurella multocida]